MKKFIIWLFVSMLFYNVWYWAYCDQSFPVKKVRYLSTQDFYDDIHNNTWYTIKIKDFWWNFFERLDFWEFRDNQWNIINKFISHYDPEIIRKKWILENGFRGTIWHSYRYYLLGHPEKLNTTPSKSNYTESDATKYDLFARYTVKYAPIINGVESTKIAEHTECIPYVISWCWDWILDRDYWETCDSKDPNKEWWWPGWCDEECKPKQTPTNPECKVLNVTPKTWNTPLTSTFTCEWLNTNTYKIDIKDETGKVIHTINNKTGSYTFTDAKKYTATCYVENGTITSPDCNQEVTPTTPTAPECTNLSLSPSSWAFPMESTLTCTWKNVADDKFKIEIKDPAWNIVQTINNKTWKFTFTDKDQRGYTATCYADGQTSTSCRQIIKDTPGRTPSGRCETLTLNPNKRTVYAWERFDFECKWIWSRYDIQIVDRDQPVWKNILHTINSNRWSYRFDKSWNYDIFCYVDGINTGWYCKESLSPEGRPPRNPPNNWWGGGWGWNNPYCWDGHKDTWEQCDEWSRNGTVWSGCSKDCKYNYCWDWILQRPNMQWQMEECDLWERNGKPGSYCSADCKLWWPQSFPEESLLKFGPIWTKIIGFWMNPYFAYERPYIENINKEKGQIYVREVCITTNASKFEKWISRHLTKLNSKWKSIKIGNNWMICKTINRILKPGEKAEIPVTKDDAIAFKFKWDGNISKNVDENVIVATIRTDSGRTFEDTYYLSSKDEFRVRVARWSISAKWGWSSYVSNKNTSDLSEVWKDLTKDNKNFVWLSLTSFLDSYSKKINEEKTTSKIDRGTDDSRFGKFGSYSSSEDNRNKEKVNFAQNEFKVYNWINWAYIARDKNIEIREDINKDNRLTWPRTYIIDGGDLYINSNITYSDNIAFVVRWGKIKIWNNVTTLNWTYISIPAGTPKKGWFIEWDRETTIQLVVNGSLYGDVSDLVEKRTYMKLNDKWQLDVWTVVSFGSSTFRKPAPLTSTFIDEYVKATKVAK